MRIFVTCSTIFVFHCRYITFRPNIFIEQRSTTQRPVASIRRHCSHKAWLDDDLFLRLPAIEAARRIRHGMWGKACDL